MLFFSGSYKMMGHLHSSSDKHDHFNLNASAMHDDILACIRQIHFEGKFFIIL